MTDESSNKEVLGVLRNTTELVVGYVEEKTADTVTLTDPHMAVFIANEQDPAKANVQFVPLDILCMRPPVRLSAVRGADEDGAVPPFKVSFNKNYVFDINVALNDMLSDAFKKYTNNLTELTQKKVEPLRAVADEDAVPEKPLELF